MLYSGINFDLVFSVTDCPLDSFTINLNVDTLVISLLIEIPLGTFLTTVILTEVLYDIC